MSKDREEREELIKKITKMVADELTPFADDEWRKDHPPDGWKWTSKRLTDLSELVARRIADWHKAARREWLKGLLDTEKETVRRMRCEPSLNNMAIDTIDAIAAAGGLHD